MSPDDPWDQSLDGLSSLDPGESASCHPVSKESLNSFLHGRWIAEIPDRNVHHRVAGGHVHRTFGIRVGCELQGRGGLSMPEHPVTQTGTPEDAELWLLRVSWPNHDPAVLPAVEPIDRGPDIVSRCFEGLAVGERASVVIPVFD